MKKCIPFVIILLLLGCKKEDKKYNVEMYCNGVKTEIEVMKSDVLGCKLLDEDYKFKVLDINDDMIYIESNEYGLTDDNNLETEKKKFVINKNGELRLTTQTLDYQESVIFKLKD